MKPRPFVKWAGGKGQILDYIHRLLPTKYGSYHEPFVGGGAMLFSIMDYTGRAYHISDINEELIVTYRTIRDSLYELREALEMHKQEFHKDRKKYYYEVRAQVPAGNIEVASRFIFLNKTCFNGLYRVNNRGLFNVPIGSNERPKILDEVNLTAVSGALNAYDITLECADFGAVLDRAEPGDLVYFDPPYHPITDRGNFTKYTDRDFSYNDLQRLASVCNSLDRMGCHVVLSNSIADEVVELFDTEPWRITRIRAARYINSVGSDRTGHYELLIDNHGAQAVQDSPV